MGLLNDSFIKSYVLAETKYRETHGATEKLLGSGILYYGLAYMLQAKVCLCLGSGGGFVPRMMRQAQRDCGIEDSRTILVDANMPQAGWGSPDYMDGPTVFTENFDVEILPLKTQEAFWKLKRCMVDYLHIDADHRYDAVTVDFHLYKSLLSANSVITLHDTGGSGRCGVQQLLDDLREENSEYDLVDFPFVGEGVAVVRKKTTKIHA